MDAVLSEMSEDADEETDIQYRERGQFHPDIQLPGISPYITPSFDTLPTLSRHSRLSYNTQLRKESAQRGLLFTVFSGLLFSTSQIYKGKVTHNEEAGNRFKVDVNQDNVRYSAIIIMDV